MEAEVDSVRRLEAKLGYRFADAELARTALTHRSAAHEEGGEHYERLEFLGDAVLGLVAARWLFARLPDEPEGALARIKSYLVSGKVLAGIARDLELGSLLSLGAGEARSGGRRKRSLLADSIEAVLGAVFLDGGLAAVESIVIPWYRRILEEQPLLGDQDAKTRLQELLQGLGKALPEYRLVEASGPDHQRTFRIDCLLDERVLGSGEGSSKKVAERRAARAALEALECGREPGVESAKMRRHE